MAKAANLAKVQKVGAAAAAIEKEIAVAKAIVAVPPVLGAPGAVGTEATPAGLGAPGPVGTSVTPRTSPRSVTPRTSPRRAAAAAGGGEEREDKEERRRRRHSERGSEGKHKRRRRTRTSGDVEVQHMFHGWPFVLKFKTKQN